MKLLSELRLDNTPAAIAVELSSLVPNPEGPVRSIGE